MHFWDFQRSLNSSRKHISWHILKQGVSFVRQEPKLEKLRWSYFKNTLLCSRNVAEKIFTIFKFIYSILWTSVQNITIQGLIFHGHRDFSNQLGFYNHMGDKRKFIRTPIKLMEFQIFLLHCCNLHSWKPFFWVVERAMKIDMHRRWRSRRKTNNSNVNWILG